MPVEGTGAVPASAVMAGERTLLVECAARWLERGHRLSALVSPEPALREWARERGVPAVERLDGLPAVLGGEPFDYFFGITYLRIVPRALLDLPRRLAVNFHDALLPRNAGMYATSWALLDAPAEHGVTWHVMTEGADEGDILLRREVAVGPDDTAYDLNTACFQAGMDSFGELADLLTAGRAVPVPQDLRQRTYHARVDVLPAGGLLRWERAGRELHALVRATLLGRGDNAFGTAKIALPAGWAVPAGSRLLPTRSGRPPGTVLAADASGLTVATGDQDLFLGPLRSPEGTPLSAEALGLGPGTRLPLPTAADAAALTARLRATRRHEARWVRRLASVRPLDLPYCGVAGPVAGAGGHAEGGAGVVAYDVAVPSGLVAGAGVEPPLAALAGVLLYLGRVAGVAGEAAGDVGLRAAADPGPYFAQTVPLRVPAAADGTGFAAYCGQLAAAVAEVEAWGGTYPRDLGVRHPALTGAPGLPVVVGAEGGAGGAVPGAAVQVVVAPDGEHCRLLLAADRVEPGAADALRTDLAAFLTALAGAPGDIGAVPLLSGPRRAQVLEEWNATDTAARPDARVCDLFAAQAASRPDAVAVVADDATLTYAELAARASRVAAALSRAGIGPGDLVGVHLGRGADLVAALLGVMHAGAAYVPLDPLYPADRIRAMAEDAGLRLLLTGGGLPLPPELAATGIARLDVTDPALPPGEAGAPAPAATPPQAADAGPGAAGPGAQLPHRAGDLAYVIYTSGSTGRPKGVRIGHRALTNFLLSMAAEPGCRPGERLLAVTTVCFDIAGLELFLPLVTGGCVELVPAEVARDGFALCQRLRRSRPALMQATPATWRLLTAAGWEGDGNLRALCGGEPLPADLANELLDRTGELWNLYGPTETTVWSTAARVRPGDRITLGRPLANTRCYVLDRSGRPLPPYVPGELCIGGAGVAEGYLGRPELTAEKFVPDPFTGTGRLYRTGDLVRRLGDGRLDCLGRIDDQVKIDGFRIEPGEIEAALLRHPGVRRAVVAARADAAGTRRLVAYVVPAGQVAPGAEELRRHLARDLPGYMVPARYVPLPEIPLTRNGKVDRKALPDPPRTTATALPPAARPRTAPEAAVARVWRAVLGRDDIGLDDNFFDAGGTSLLLTQAVTRLNAELGVRLRSVDMFRNPTVRTMAGCLAAPAAPPAAADEPARRIDRSLIRRRKRRA